MSKKRGGFPVILQHDTVIKPTDCGGPLVDLDGKAVGINIARAGRTESYAIPTEAVLGLIADLKSGKLAPKADPEPTVADLEKGLQQLRDDLKRNEDVLRTIEKQRQTVEEKRKATEKRVAELRKKLAEAQAALDRIKKDETKK